MEEGKPSFCSTDRAHALRSTYVDASPVGWALMALMRCVLCYGFFQGRNELSTEKLTGGAN